jgi:long-chain acyl-CoA synthetase
MRGEAPFGCITLDSVRDIGQKLLESDPDCVKREISKIQDSDLATIIYTSGTTGNPKGVQLTHGNILHNICVIPQIIRFPDEGVYISFLPSWHTFERTIEYVVLDHGMQLHYSSKWTLKQDLLRIRPHFMVGVPRLWETFVASVLGKVDTMKGLGGALVRGSLNGSRIRSSALRRLRKLVLDKDGAVPKSTATQKIGDALVCGLLSLPHWVADRLVYRRIRQSLGGRLTVAVSGGGPLPLYVDEFLTRARIPLLNGYGLTESSPVISVRRLERNRLGTIGTPVPDTEVRILSEDGKQQPAGTRGIIHARGPQIMAGYYANAEATRMAVDDEGWLNTGDIGMLTVEGDVLITGRARAS